MSRRPFAWVIVALLATASRSSLAQDEPAPQSPEAATPSATVVPPKILEDRGVAYPKEAWLALASPRVAVRLLLVVGEDGRVQDATLDGEAPAPFAELALAAAREIRFAPATREGKPMRAKIRYTYRFVAPPVRFRVRAVDVTTGQPVIGASYAVSAKDGTAPPLSKRDDGWQEGESDTPGTLRLTASADGFQPNVAEFSLPFGELAEVTIPLLPAAPVAEPSTEDTNRAPLPSNEPPIEVTVWGEKLAPTVKTFTREEVRQLPGAFGDPFRAIEVMPGVTPLISGLPFFYVRGAPPGNVGYFLDDIRVPYLFHLLLGPSVVHPGLVDRVDLYSGGYPARLGRFAGGVVNAVTTPPRTDPHGEGNIRLFDAGAMAETGFANGKGTLLAGMRYSYTAALLSVMSPEIGLDYRDYQLRTSYDVTPNDRLSLFGFGAYDLLSETSNGIEQTLFGTEFYRLSLRYEHRSPTGMLRVAVTPGYDKTIVAEGGNGKTKTIASRLDAEQRLAPTVVLRGGADVQLEENRFNMPTFSDPDDPSRAVITTLFPTRTDTAVGLYSDCVWEAAPNLEVTPGVRLDFYRFGSESRVAVEPRISARYALAPRVHVIHAFGLAHQPPSFVLPMAGMNPGDLSGGLQKSIQVSSGAEIDLGDKTTTTGTVFYSAFYDMTDAMGSGAMENDSDDALLQRSRGQAVGLELSIKRPLTTRLGGYASYTLARSTRTLGKEHFFSTFDRTHVLNAALAYNLGRNWRAGTRVTFYTGIPITPETSPGVVPPPRTMSVRRTDPFFRIDLRTEKRWTWESGVWISFVAEVMNATLSREMIGDETIGPITIPSIGLEGGS